MKNRALIVMGLLSVALSLLISCDQPMGYTGDVTISYAGYSIQNVDNSYWSDGWNDATMLYKYYVDYEEDLSAGDIESLVIVRPTGTSTIDASDLVINTATRTIATGWFFSSTYPDSVPLGTYSMTLKLVNGNSDTVDMDVSEPGSLAVSTNDWVTSVAPVAGKVAAIPRATLVSDSKVGSTLTVTFSVNHTAANNGYIWLYDAAGNYLGFSGFFKDDAGAATSICPTFNNAGGNTVVTITAVAGVDLTQASTYHVIITDGGQYGNKTWWDHRSISTKGTF